MYTHEDYEADQRGAGWGSLEDLKDEAARKLKESYVIRRITLPIWQGARGMKKAQENPVEFVVLKAQYFVDRAERAEGTFYGSFYDLSFYSQGSNGFAYGIRQNGKVRTWKRKDLVEIPFKYGLKDCFTASAYLREEPLANGTILVTAESFDR
jgi:hypothetical protein